MFEVFGSAQPILSTAREQAKKNNYPYLMLITSTPNGAGGGTGSWFYDRYENSVNTDLLFDENEQWTPNKETIINDPSKNGFLRTRFHWSEDPRKDQAWYIEQCRELSDKRKINQELDLIFVGSSNCIFEDELLSEFKSHNHIQLYSCPYETNLVVYEKDLNKNDYYLIGVDTARSLTGAFNSIEVFSFAKFNQIAEFNYRLGSFTKYGEIIDAVFRWLFSQVAGNIIIAIENNTIGLAPIEHLLGIKDINYADYIYKDPVVKNPGKKSSNKEEWGISTTGVSKDHMIGCFTEILKEDPSVIKSQALIDQLSAIERTRGGSISSETFSDLFMAASFCAYARKMRAIEIMPLINMGAIEYNKQRHDVFREALELNVSRQMSAPEEASPTFYVEEEINQLIKINDKAQEIDLDSFSPFL